MRFTFLKIEPSREPRGNARIYGLGGIFNSKSLTEMYATYGSWDMAPSRYSILVECKPKLMNILQRIIKGPKPHGSNGWIVISSPFVFNFSDDISDFHRRELHKIGYPHIGPFYYKVLMISNRYNSISSSLGGEDRQIFKVSYEGSRTEYSIDEEMPNDVFEEL